MPWVTTKSGKRINTDWFDEDEKRKQQQIEQNKEQADNKNLDRNKTKNALIYAKEKIDKESASLQELWEDAKYEYKLNPQESQRLYDSMKFYALKNGKFKNRHDEWKKDLAAKGLDVDKELENRKPIVETNDPKSLIPKNSYINDKEYKEASNFLRQHSNERRELNSKYVETSKKYNEERDKHLDPEMVSLLGKSEARMFVKDSDSPQLAELRNQLDSISNQQKTLDQEMDKYRDYMERIDKTVSKAQRINYGEPNFKEAKGEYRGFKSNESTTSYIDDLVKEGKAKIVEMSPEQYMHECAHYIFTDSTFEKVLRGRLDDAETQKYAKMMREGTKFDTPYLNYKDEQQEGLHRAVAAYINGLEKMPVIIIGRRR